MLPNEIERIYVVYTTVQDMLRARGYVLHDAVSSFAEFKRRFMKHKTICREDLDMQLDDVHDNTHGYQGIGDRKMTHVIFLSSPEKKAISVQQIRTIVQRLAPYSISKCLLIHEQPLSTGAKKELEKLDVIEAFEETQLLFNIFQHETVPPYRKLDLNEKMELMNKYQLRETLFPIVTKQDPMARFLGLKRGDVIEIVRTSETAGQYTNYRVCV